MSEERFVGCEDSNGLKSIFDNQDKENEPLLFNCIGEVDVIVDLLNKQEQQIQMTEERFKGEEYKIIDLQETLAIADKDNCKYYQNDNDHFEELCELSNMYIYKINELNWMQEELAKKLNESDKEIEYWKENAMTLLLQVRRLLPRMNDKEIAEYSKELEKIQDER